MRTRNGWLALVAGPLLLLSMTGCATPEYAAGPLENLIKAAPGEVVQDERRAPGTTKTSKLTVKTEEMFAKWCDQRRGWVVPAGNMAQAYNKVAGAFAGGAGYVLTDGRGYRWSPDSRLEMSACVVRSKENELQAMLMVSQDLKAGDQISTFYTAEQAEAFSKRAATAQAKRTAEVTAETQRNLDQQTREMQRLRTAPQVGDRTRQGMILELRGPMALIQHEARFRQYYGLGDQAWYRIDELQAP